MAQPHCPLCEAPINEDFGLIECPGCGAQLVVHMDGRVEHSGFERADFAESEISESRRTSDSESEEAPSFIDQIGDFEIVEQTKSNVEPVDLGGTEVMHEFAEPEASPVEELSPEAESNPEEDPSPLEESAPIEEPNFDMEDSGSVTEQYVGPTVEPSHVDSPELQDVAQFANSSESGGREGNLKYSILVSGIDTADVREAFKEALTDKKLLWDLDEILKKIKLGKVKIENVSSTKAYVVVTRLKHLPVKVTWEQHAIQQG